MVDPSLLLCVGQCIVDSAALGAMNRQAALPWSEGLQEYLADRGIATGIHYPLALPNLPAYQYLDCGPDDFPVASQYQEEVLSLPMFPELTDEQVAAITAAIRGFMA